MEERNGGVGLGTQQRALATERLLAPAATTQLAAAPLRSARTEEENARVGHQCNANVDTLGLAARDATRHRAAGQGVRAGRGSGPLRRTAAALPACLRRCLLASAAPQQRALAPAARQAGRRGTHLPMRTERQPSSASTSISSSTAACLAARACVRGRFSSAVYLRVN